MSNLNWFKRPTINWETVDETVSRAYVGGTVIVLTETGIDPVFFVKPGTHVVLSDDAEGLYPRLLAEYQKGMEFDLDNWPLKESSVEEWEYAERQLSLLQGEAEAAAELEEPVDDYLDLEGKLTGVRYRQ